MKKDFGIDFKDGYSEKECVKSMEKIQNYINEIGYKSFLRLKKGTPLTRIFDKIVFITNTEEKNNVD